MDVLVAGKGFIGEKIGAKLEKNGHAVKYLDRSKGNFQHDITQDFNIDESFDVLIHTVGLAPGFATRKQYEKVHVEGTKNLLDAVDCGKIIYLSALGVGEVEHSFFQTKQQAETLIKSSGVDYTILRPSTVYGEGNKLLDMMRSFAPTRVFPDLKTLTQPILIDDLTSVVERVLESHNEEVLDAAGKDKMALGQLAKSMYNEEGYSCALVPMPEFLIQVKLLGLSFLGPPFRPENIEIVRSSNTTDENDAEELVSLSSLF